MLEARAPLRRLPQRLRHPRRAGDGRVTGRRALRGERPAGRRPPRLRGARPGDPAGGRAVRRVLLRQLQAPISWSAYLGSADFWGRTLQNWQSELLAVASMAILSVSLRQRGSPESKPVGAAHTATGVEV